MARRTTHTASFILLIGDLSPIFFNLRLLKGIGAVKYRWRRLKNFATCCTTCNTACTLAFQQNLAIYISFYYYVYIWESFLGGVYIFLSKPLFFFRLTQAFWKIHRYPATFRCILAFMRCPAWRITWQNYVGSPFLTFHTYEVQ
jgi:hypothetical protein